MGQSTHGTWKLTQARRQVFLQLLANGASPSLAARAVGVSKQTMYAARQRSATFRQAWEDAREDAIDRLVDALYQRAISHSDQAAMFLLRAWRPETYRETMNVEHRIRAAAVAVGLDPDAVVEDAVAILRQARE